MLKNKKNNKNNFIKAFTLIELLVVISVLGILISMVTASLTTSQKQARDTQRKSDLAQYRTVLETYANANSGLYPSYLEDSPMDEICTSLLSDYTGSCPTDPKPATRNYGYKSNGSGVAGGPTATKYLIYVDGGLESTINTWVVCSDGNSNSVINNWTSIDAFCPM